VGGARGTEAQEVVVQAAEEAKKKLGRIGAGQQRDNVPGRGAEGISVTP
jgi:hypothetical protein